MTPTTYVAGGIAASLPLSSVVQADPEKVAVFDFQFARGAQTLPTDDDKARLRKTAEEFRMNVYFKPLKESAAEKAYGVDLRGDTHESFDRGIKYLVKNQLLERRRRVAEVCGNFPITPHRGKYLAGNDCASEKQCSSGYCTSLSTISG